MAAVSLLSTHAFFFATVKPTQNEFIVDFDERANERKNTTK